MHNRFRMLRLQRGGPLSAAVLLLMLVVLTIFDATGHAAAVNEVDEGAHGRYSELKSGTRIWEHKAYVTPEQPTVYLTFDDGPSKLTDQVLDILRDEDVKGTFFVLGKQVESHPQLVRRAVQEGHAIGNHTYDHVYKDIYSGAESFWNQIQQTEQSLEKHAGVKPRLVRAPGGTFGNFDAFYFYYMDQAGYEVHDWNIDSGDSARPGVPASDIVRTVSKGPFRHEVIVLMHDGTGHEQTVKALPEIIRLFKKKGYAFASLDERVKPVHFSAGKVKWARTVTEQAHRKLLAEAERHRIDMEQEEKALEPLPLQISFGDDGLLLSPGQYRLKDGRYEVPLRLLIESMGGRIDWRAADRTAVVRYGMYGAEYDFSQHELRAKDGGKETAYHIPQMVLREGTVYVPLRETLELLGCRIADERASGEGRFVSVRTSGGMMAKLDF